MTQSPFFYDEAALVERLSNGIRKRCQEVIFLLGAPMSAPMATGLPGVPAVQGIVDLITAEFRDEPAQLLLRALNW